VPPCLTSSIALSYRILSAPRCFSALVDLLTFSSYKICASHRMTLSRNSPISTNKVKRIVIASKKYGANFTSLSNLGFRATVHESRDAPSAPSGLERLKYNRTKQAEQLTLPLDSSATLPSL